MALKTRRPESIPAHVAGLLQFISQPHEKANEDLALAYFRHLYPESFRRQTDAAGADGYVPGSFVLELKGRTADWFAGLCQGIAYRRELDFSVVVVAAKEFLAAWRIADLPNTLRDEILAAGGPASTVGRTFARTYARNQRQILRGAVWTGSHISLELFAANPALVLADLETFTQTLRDAKRIRQSITPRNFTTIVKQMTEYFSPEEPTKAVNAFYSMVYAWDDHSVLQVSNRVPSQAALGGEAIVDLLPGKRLAFKQFVESHAIRLGPSENTDDFFARYDQALDAADKKFRIRNGIFFTDLSLSKFALWLVKQYVPDLGKNYIVVDPACGSGNLVSNWRSPLELRHKVVSEIAPDLLHVVEKRMQGDQWHHGKFTVVPKTAERRGLNFLDKPAGEYLAEVTAYLNEKGYRADKPLAFLCNPPYRSDDDQSATPISYDIDPSIVDMIGRDATAERYCCFLAQMALVCKQALDSGLPGASVLLVFTKAAWLTERPMFRQIRRSILRQFRDCGGFLVNSKQFFDVKGRFPIAFTVWMFEGESAEIDADRPIPLIDLTHVSKNELAALPWGDDSKIDRRCRELIESGQRVTLGVDRVPLKCWVGQSMTDFKRSRRAAESGATVAGGLPRDDARARNKKAYGEATGTTIGFMDNLTPCRTRRPSAAVPHFHLDPRFMRVRDARCLSGHSDHYSYRAETSEQAARLFFWYAVARTFAHCGYPLWVDASEIWAPHSDYQPDAETIAYSFAIGFSENECVETVFPAGNPTLEAPEVTCTNPMAPNSDTSFWRQHMESAARATPSRTIAHVIESVNDVYSLWASRFSRTAEIYAPYRRPYFIRDGALRATAGLVQIRDYAMETGDSRLTRELEGLRARINQIKTEFHERLLDPKGIDYFGAPQRRTTAARRTRFDEILARRLVLAGMIVHELRTDKHLGRTKLAKVFYLADVAEGLNLDAHYVREAAGPLDARALYSETVGIEPLARARGYFDTSKRGRAVRYVPGPALETVTADAAALLGPKWERVKRIIDLCRPLNTDQAEIVATLYACWNDLLIARRHVGDDAIIDDFLQNWHDAKRRFARRRLTNALEWMRHQQLVPQGRGKKTQKKDDRG